MTNDDDGYTYLEAIDGERLGSSKKRKTVNKRRFSNEQIKSLETIFESESKLEPRKKLQLARELGLQPRQIAIWFQNKRARYKSKQLEQEFSILRANYNNLMSQFETLKKEKQALQVQLQRLNDQMKKSQDENRMDGGDESGDKFKSKSTISAEKSEERVGVLSDDDVSIEAACFVLDGELRPSLLLARSEHNTGVLSDEDSSSIKAEYFGLDDKPELLNMVGPADSTLTSPENWGSLESEGLIDQSGSGCQWWDVWS